MKPRRPRRVEELIQAALARPEASRRAFVEEACERDSELLSEVLAGLAEAERIASHDVAPTEADPAGLGVDDEIRLEQEASIGPYRTVREIGRGGMGTVLLAERADGLFEQRVALKLLRRGLDSERAVRRFRSERQILARLQHANIARLLDGGVTRDGRPFLVMEHVAGVPITEYCDSRRLGVDARVELLLDVGRAVAYAHRNLVVHRDLKPSNILVTEDGTVKLLDFGIAKLLSEEEDDQAALTEPGARAMTPDYAAPEQIKGETITTATDTYGLGLVLYELLTGHRPFRLKSRTLEELERIVLLRAREPERPSAIVRRSQERRDDNGHPVEVPPSTIAAERGTSPERLRRRLTGDLDTICLMAIRKERERRYQSADQLVEDLKRHLTSLPVLARPDTFRYRAGKFVRRHRLGVLTAATVGLVILGFSMAVVLQSARIARERDKAERVSELLVDLFRISDPSEARGKTITAREVLDEGVEKVDAGLQDQPEVQAALLDVMGRVYQNLGLYERATPLLEKALAIREGGGGASDQEIAASLSHLGLLLADKGVYPEAERFLRRSLELSTRISGEESTSVAQGKNHLGMVLFKQGRYADAEPLLAESLELNRRIHGEDHPDVAAGLNDLGMLHYGKGDYAGAEPLLRRAVVMRRQQLGEGHPLLADSQSNLASVLGRQGRYGDAEEAQRRALAIRRKTLGPDHPRLATSLNNLALILFSKGDHAAAEPLLQESLAVRRRSLGAKHPDTAQSLSNLGLLLQTTGRLGEAEVLYREALAIRREAFGGEHVRIAQSLNNLGLLLHARGDLAAAEPPLREGLAMMREQVGERHPFVATNLNNLATVLDAADQDEAAEALYREALEIRREVLPPRHPHVAYAQLGLGRLLLASGRAGEAEPLLREAVSIRLEVFGAAHPQTTEAQRALDECLTAMSRGAPQ